MENYNRYVSSRGILKSCAARNSIPRSSNSTLDLNFANTLKESPKTIYVNTDALVNFIENFLPQIQFPFNLVTGDSDTRIDEAFFDYFNINKIIESDVIRKWYAQNLYIPTDKISHLPIGIDYHTMYQYPNLWGQGAEYPFGQENQLIQIQKNSPDPQNRIPLAYSNWHLKLDRGDRGKCYESIDHKALYFEENFLPRYTSWARQTKYFFVLSPEGAGPDCHRTWEALILGQVPIIKRSHLSPLFAGLPVIEVENWEEVTNNFLIDSVNKVLSCRYDYSKLFLNYWVRTLNDVVNNDELKMSLYDYKVLSYSSSF